MNILRKTFNILCTYGAGTKSAGGLDTKMILVGEGDEIATAVASINAGIICIYFKSQSHIHHYVTDSYRIIFKFSLLYLSFYERRIQYHF